MSISLDELDRREKNAAAAAAAEDEDTGTEKTAAELAFERVQAKRVCVKLCHLFFYLFFCTLLLIPNAVCYAFSMCVAKGIGKETGTKVLQRKGGRVQHQDCQAERTS